MKAINAIKDRIQKRSENTRSDYLRNIDFWKENSPNRNNLGCSNLAHTYASCNSKAPTESLNIKKFVGIITAYNDMLSAHAPLEAYPRELKKEASKLNLHIQVAGGVPAMCDGLSHNVFDSAICMGTCDKIVPGLLIGALKFGHLPVIFIPGGPMATGISNSKKNETRQSYAAGEIEKIELLTIEQQAYHSEGTCTFYGTANTNQLIAEAMGFQLPGAAFTPTDSPIRNCLNNESLRSLMRLMDAEMGLGEMLDVKNWVNAIIVLLASGGSTNLVIHLIAMARSAGYIITIEDFNDLSSMIPLLCQIYPNGNADVNEFHSEGGVARLLKNLIDGELIYEDIHTVAGLGLSHYTKVPTIGVSQSSELQWEELAIHSKPLKSITTAHKPYKPNGGIKFIGGDIAEGLIKVSALKNENEIISAPVRVFLTQDEVLNAYADAELNQDMILVLLGQSPSINGMPELHKLTSPINVLQKRGYKIALVTDGRMSGASGSFPALIHAVSENNNLYKIRTGDILTLDLKERMLTIDSDEYKKRAAIEIAPSNIGLGRELFKIFRDNVSSVKLGATIFHD